MKNLKRLIPIYIIMVYCVVALAGCSNASYEGKELVDKAKALHTELEAAHITVQDIRGGHYSDRPPVQEIWYRFQGDVMQYMYIGRDLETGEEYYEFNNGTELDTWHTGDAAWTGVAKGSEGYYNYSRSKRHYFADGDKLLDDHISAVKSAEEDLDIGRRKKVSIKYDDSIISQFEQMTSASDYSQIYGLTEIGRCDEVYINYDTDGGVHRRYCVYISETDPTVPIERVEPPALSGEITENVQ